MKTAIIFLALIAGISAQFSATAQQQNNGIPPSELPPKTTQTPVQLDTLEQLDSKRISSGVGLAESLEPSIHIGNVLNKPIYKQGATCSACPSPTKCDTSSGLCV
ncbi:hypothetical protein CRE_02504 [Caenorhabditis remanei]|uniref:Secreted protein n=1 Tax=Caenorhabditis remanei TaxID=31234 RepID=E3MWX1_CAERE|nr:hypothetical protein CRE_02504 [Caenorhabditis remanei]